MQSNVSRACRVLVPSEPGKISAAPIVNRTSLAGAPATMRNAALDPRKEIVPEAARAITPEDSLVTPPSATETVTTPCGDDIDQFRVQGGHAAMADRNSSLTPESVTETITTSHGEDTGQFAVQGADPVPADRILPEQLPVGGNPSLAFQRVEGQQNMKLSVATSSLVKREELRQDQHFMDQAIRPSVAGATCATTMSVYSGPSYQCTRASSGQTACVTQMSSSAAENAASGRDREGRVASVKGDGLQAPQLGGDQEKGVSGNLALTNNVLPPNGSSQPAKTEKTARKKKYDPDLFFKVNGKLYQKLGKIGSGGSSEVHKVISSDCTIYALKKIKLRGRDYPTAYGFCQEIEYLNRLKGKRNIIQLIDYEVTDKILLQGVQDGSTMSVREGRIKDDQYIYMVLEYGEIDLAHMLSQKWKEMDGSNWKMDENWLRFYWQQMLEAVNTIHEERIVHSDLKPANFLLVRGSLKLIDFGIAKAIMSDTTNIQRDAQVGTLNYMSPEAFMWNEHDSSGNTIKCGRSSDIWSLGCILYQMVYGKTPFAEYKNFWAKFKVITDKNHEIEYEPVSNQWLIDLMKRCLAWDRNERWRIPQLLQHPFLVPPMPREEPLSDDHPSKLLLEKAGVYWDDPEVSRICYELHKTVASLEQKKKDDGMDA